MILSRVIGHFRKQEWTAIGIDFIIVVVGVGVALLAEQWIRDVQKRSDAIRAELEINDELIRLYVNAEERLTLKACNRERIQAIADALLEPGEAWTGMPLDAKPLSEDDRMKGLSGGIRSYLPVVLRPPHRLWDSGLWSAELARGTVDDMDPERRRTINQIYLQARIADTYQAKIYDLHAQLKPLARNTILPQRERLRYYEILAAIDEYEALMETVLIQIATPIEELGIDFARFEMQAPFTLETFNAKHREVHGDCVGSIRFPGEVD